MRYEKPDNLVSLFEESVEEFGSNPLFGKINSDDKIDWLSYTDVSRRVDNLRCALGEIGLAQGDSVGMIANNRTEWAVVALASYGLGASFVPMYEAELETVWEYIIKDSALKVLFVADRVIFDKISHLREKIDTLEHIFIVDDDEGMPALERKGAKMSLESIKPDAGDVACLVYTSGTTGDPKGVLLTHGNFTSNARAGRRIYPDVDDRLRFISILPWAHSFAQTAELYNAIQLGGSIVFMRSISKLAQDMLIVRPTHIIGVPRVFNRIYDGLWAQMKSTGGNTLKIFEMAVESARKKRELEEQGRFSILNEIIFRIGDFLVFRKIRQRLGGRLECAMTASATMNPNISKFFFDVGIPVYDCYGLSETSPGITMNCPGVHRIGSVGRAIEYVRVEIDQSVVEDGARDGEIVCYGPNVMKGYHNKPEETESVMTPDGGFRTGDRGRIDKDGFLFITGRIKEQYKLENGKYVFPAAIEEEIRLIPEVANVMIYGEGKLYNVGLVVPDIEVINAANGRNPDLSVKDDPELQKRITDAIAARLDGKFGAYEIPRKYLFVDEDFTLENGMLTQTLKLKRRAVLGKYGSEIENLYQN